MAESTKQTEPKAAKKRPDDLVKTSKKGDIELSEDQLRNVVGGDTGETKHKDFT